MLCLASDGDVHIEAGTHSSCGMPDGPFAQSNAALSGNEHAERGQCLDVALDTTASDQQAKYTPSLPPAQAPLGTPVALSPPVPSLPLSKPGFSSPQLVALHTIVLLI